VPRLTAREAECRVKFMSVKEIEAAISRLSAGDLAELIAWLQDHAARLWDEQIEKDLREGRLDALLAEVVEEGEAGQGRPI
jgi:endo-1,4-beta-D-glucanase Y